MNLKEALQAFLDHRREVLQRAQPASASPRSRAAWRSCAARSSSIVNLDEVIRIIREGDDPKAEMMARWELTEVQAEAILNMRLRALAPARGDRDPQGARRARGRGRASSTALLGEREAAMARDRQGGRRDRKPNSAATRRSAAAAPRSAPRRRRSRSRSRRWSSASRSRCCARTRAGSARSRATTSPAAEQKYKEGDGPRFVGRRPRRPTG